MRTSGIDYTILRPAVIYGPRGDFMKRMLFLTSFPVIPIFGEGDYRLRPIFVGDVSKCIIACLEGKANKETIEIAGPEEMSYIEMVSKICEAIGKKPTFLKIPLWLSKAVVASISFLPFAPITTLQLSMLLEGSGCDIQNMTKKLGITPIGFKEGLKVSL